jgi:hypothetical protein
MITLGEWLDDENNLGCPLGRDEGYEDVDRD